MPYYSYRAIDDKGQKRSGRIDAPSRAAAVDRLAKLGQIPLDIRPGRPGLWAKLNQDVEFSGSVNRRDIGDLTRELKSLLATGVTLERALAIMIGSDRKKTVQTMLIRIHERLRAGHGFAEALAEESGRFPPYYINMIRAGELSGTLSDVTARLSGTLDKAQNVRDGIRSALIYPAILLMMVGVTLVLVVMVVLPQFAPLFEGAEDRLPLITRIVMAIGLAAVKYWWAFLLLFLLTVGIGFQLLRDPKARKRIDCWLLSPKLMGSLAGRIDIARLLRTLGAMMANGIALLPALEIGGRVLGNRALRDGHAEGMKDLKEGGRISGLFEKLPYFPPVALQLTRVGEETGSLDKMFLEAADLLDQEIETSIKRFMAAFVPMVTLVLGGIVAALIGSVLLGMMSVNELV